MVRRGDKRRKLAARYRERPDGERSRNRHLHLVLAFGGALRLVRRRAHRKTPGRHDHHLRAVRTILEPFTGTGMEAAALARTDGNLDALARLCRARIDRERPGQTNYSNSQQAMSAQLSVILATSTQPDSYHDGCDLWVPARLAQLHVERAVAAVAGAGARVAEHDGSQLGLLEPLGNAAAQDATLRFPKAAAR